MGRRLAAAARAIGETVPRLDYLVQYIYHWERGLVVPGACYVLYYCHAPGIPGAAFGPSRRSGEAAPAAGWACRKGGVR